MKVIQPNCRIQFTAEDVAFIVTTLRKGDEQTQLIRDLLTDPHARDLMLEDEQLYRAVLEDSACLQISQHLYFYILTRHSLKKAGLDDRQVADYVAEVLCEYSQWEKTRCRLPGEEAPLDYCFEMVGALQRVDERTRFCLRTHIGNHTLFFAGLFAARIKDRAERRGFPDLGYYESLGQSNYRIASDHRLASRYDLSHVLGTLGEGFHHARVALNDMADRLLHLGDEGQPLPAFIRAA